MNLNSYGQSKEFAGFLHISTGIVEAIFFMGFYLIILAGPLLQGLYYEFEFMPALLVLGLIMAVGLIIGRARLPINKTFQPLDISMFGLVLAYLLSLTTAIHQHQAVIGLLQMCSYFMAYWLASRIVSEAMGFKGLLASGYLAAIVMSLVGLAAALGWVDWAGFYTEGEGLICSTLQYHNALAIYVAAASLIGFAWLLETKTIAGRIILAGGNYLLIVVLIGSLSRGTWLVYPLGLVLLLGMLPAKERARAVLYMLWTLLTALLTGRFFFEQISNYSWIAFIILLIGLAASWLVPLFMPRRLAVSLPGMAWNKKVKLLLGGTLIIIFIVFSIFNYSKVAAILPQNAITRAGQTSLQEGSIQERLHSYQDAVKIVKDYPFTGTGGGGWAALYQQYAERRYYTKEVHNFYLKVAVEAGLLGLGMLLAVVFLFFRLILKARRQEDELPIVFWGAVAAVILIGIHAAGDFELALPGVAFLFFALLGALRGLAGDRPSQPQTSYKARKKQAAPANPEVSRTSTMINTGLCIMTLAVMLSTSCWVISNVSAQSGREALARGDLIEAKINYSRSVFLAPWNPQYRVGLATALARITAGDQQQEAYRQALEQGAAAARLAPYDIELRLNLLNLYAALRNPDRQIEECKALVKAAPFEPRAYKLAVNGLLSAAWFSLQHSDIDPAAGYLLQLLDIREAMPAVIKEYPEEIDLAAGQAALLSGHLIDAKIYLDRAAKSKDTCITAEYWLDALEKVRAMPGSTAGSPLQDMDPEMLRGVLEHR